MPNRLDEQTRTVLFILRLAYWLRILRKHTSFFMVNIVVTIIRNFNHGLKEPRPYNSGLKVRTARAKFILGLFLRSCFDLKCKNRVVK